jgi:hypothetical protein
MSLSSMRGNYDRVRNMQCGTRARGCGHTLRSPLLRSVRKLVSETNLKWRVRGLVRDRRVTAG